MDRTQSNFQGQLLSKIKFFKQIVLMVFGLLLDVSKDKLGPARKATTSTVPEKFILQNK